MSTATVSRALSNPELVSQNARIRVDKAVKKLGYTRNVTAQSLRRRTTQTLLVALPNVGNSFFSPIVDSIERVAAARGFDILITNRRPNEHDNVSLINFYRANRADGLLLFDGNTPESELRDGDGETARRFPVVCVCEPVTFSNVPIVQVDNIGGAHLAIDEFVRLGHTDIGHLCGPVDNTLTSLRAEGYGAAMKRHHLPIVDDWQLAGDFSFAAGAAAAHRFASLPKRPTAVFCDSDELAIGFISACRELGIYCPRDVSIIGFDDIPFASQCYPALTTIRQPHAELGCMGAELLINILAGDDVENMLTALPCALVARASAIAHA